MSRLTDDDKIRGSHALIEALAKEPLEFNSLWPIASSAMGFARNIYSPGYRFTDGWLQRQRRKDYIEFKREGRQVYWSLTPAGREALALPRADRSPQGE